MEHEQQNVSNDVKDEKTQQAVVGTGPATLASDSAEEQEWWSEFYEPIMKRWKHVVKIAIEECSQPRKGERWEQYERGYIAATLRMLELYDMNTFVYFACGEDNFLKEIERGKMKKHMELHSFPAELQLGE